MLLRSLLTLTYLYSAMAFAPSPVFRSTTALFSSTEETLDVPLVVEGKNIEVTEALMAHIEKRIGGPLKKLSSSGQVTECDVILSVSKNPKIKESDQVEIITNLKGTTFACTHASPDMYNSIDQAAHALQRKLVKYKERRQDGWHGGAAMAEDFLAALESFEPADVEDSVAAQEEFVDPEAPTITKVKSFDLENGISVQEAIFALDYVDHDFYVFRNEETDKITVVYKRNGGGIGLVEP
uniref:Sigma 54 modulation/S30EA ribosomal protein C-terminal domain-containing protein n=2 Tax=Amphora coffeiformis TaxID=265554 RepID=A0A7S3KZZ2_9STRA